MELTYRENYFDDLKLKNEFIRFLNLIHNLDLTRWDDSGYWDSNYYPFSFFDKKKIVSNVSVYSIEMNIDGVKQKVAQISSVGTDPEYRKRGLSTNLLERALNFAKKEHQHIFLFADKNAQKLYQKFGFQYSAEYLPTIDLNSSNHKSLVRKLSLSNTDDLYLIDNKVTSREFISNKIGYKSRNLLYFWLIYFLNDSIYYIDDLECLILMKQENRILTIFDIIGSNIPDFEKLLPYIADKSISQIQFRFMIDKLNIENIEHIETDNGLHLSESFPLQKEKLIFPQTVQA